MVNSVPITISYGDEPDVMDAALDIARESGAVLEMEVIQSGEDIYRREIKEGIMPDIYESLKRTGILIKSATRTPKEEGYISVADAICQKLEIDTCLEYFVSDITPGVGLVVEKPASPLRVENISEVFNLSKALGGRSFCYTIDELGLMFCQKQEKFPEFTAEYKTANEATVSIGNYDIIFTDEASQPIIASAIKAKIGCRIFVGNGFRIFEPVENLNAGGKGLILALALAVKYSGQNDAAWEIYKSLSDDNTQDSAVA